MAAFVKFQAFVELLAEGNFDLSNDTLKILLTNDAPSAAADTVKADLTSELGTGGGYTSGGSALTVTAAGQTGGTYKVEANDLVFTAAGGSIGPFRYAVLYDDTVAGDPLIGYWDYGSSITLLTGETLTVDISAVNGLLQLA